MTMELIDRIQGTAQSVDDAGVLAVIAYPLPDNCVAFVRAVVVARRPDNGDSAAYTLERPVKRHGGADVAVASTNQTKVAYDTTDATWDAALTLSGTDVRVIVTGHATATVEWMAIMEVYLFQP